MAHHCHAQKASFKELKLLPNPKYYQTTEPSIIYPIIITGNQRIDSLINSQIKNDVLLSENESQPLEKCLMEYINDYGLTDLSYNITYNNYNLLSFSVFYQGCGAHCTSSNTYFNFDLSTGKKVSINDIILQDKIDSFRNIVQTDKRDSLNKYKIEEKSFIGSDDIDSATYSWIISEVNENCINEISMENFSVSHNSIEIFDPCEFPHAIRSEEPDFELKYSYSSIRRFISPKFKKLFE